MASKLHWGNYLPNQIPIFLQTHFHLLYWNLPKNSCATPFRITAVNLYLFCYSTFHDSTACSSAVTLWTPPVQTCCAYTHKQGSATGVGPHRKVCRPKTHMGFVLGVLSLEQPYGIPQSHTSRTTASSLISSKSNSASLIQAHFTSQIKCRLWEHSVD